MVTVHWFSGQPQTVSSAHLCIRHRQVGQRCMCMHLIPIRRRIAAHCAVCSLPQGLPIRSPDADKCPKRPAGNFYPLYFRENDL